MGSQIGIYRDAEDALCEVCMGQEDTFIIVTFTKKRNTTRASFDIIYIVVQISRKRDNT